MRYQALPDWRCRKMSEWKCLRCLQVISAEDTVQLVAGGMSHIDCRRPRDLSPEERALLYRYCWGHAAAKCTACAKNFRHVELAADFLGHRTNLCPQCRADLTESMRGHLYSCAMLPEEVRQRAREARDAASTLIKQSTQAADQADGLVREAESALAALRETMRRTTWGR
jgi:hypothetical protein